MSLDRSWLVRSGFDMIRLQRWGDEPPAGSRQLWVGELTDLLSTWLATETAVLRDIYEQLPGAAFRVSVPPWERDADMKGVLRSAIEHGELVGYRLPRKEEPLDVPSRPRGRLIGPGFPSRPLEVEATYFELAVVDEIGVPIAGAEVVFDVDGPQRALTGAAGVARLDDATKSFATARLPDRDAVRELLRPRWTMIRPDDWIEAQVDHTFLPLRHAETLSASLLSETRHTLVIQPWVIRARLIGWYFDTNKCFVRPEAIEDIQAVKQLHDKYPRSALLVVGHTDTTAGPAYNDVLSLERATAVTDYLCENVEGWLEHYGSQEPAEKRWGGTEDRAMIGKLPDHVTKLPGEHPVVWFQRTRGLVVDGVAGPVTRRALVGEYMRLEGTTLRPGVSIITHGCGESFPIAEEGPGRDDPGKQRNRRVELYLFDEKLGVQPPPPGTISPQGSAEYPEWVRRARETHDFELLRGLELRVRLFDRRSRPMPGVRFRAEVGEHSIEGTADGSGVAVIRGIEPPATCRLSWAPFPLVPPDSATDTNRLPPLVYEHARDVFVDADEHYDRASIERRMSNLGYDPRAELAARVDGFESDYDLKPTGKADDPIFVATLMSRHFAMDPRPEAELEDTHGPEDLEIAAEVYEPVAEEPA